MLRLFLYASVGLAVAQLNCLHGTPQLSLPSCMDQCFLTGGCNGGQCPCPQNLKGWCEMSGGGGPDSWVNRWGKCVVGDCPDDGDITSLMLLFTAQCAGTVGGPLTNDTVPTPLNDWMPKNTFKSTSTSVSTATSGASQSIATLTGVTSTGTAAPGYTSLSADTTATSSDSKATTTDDETSSQSNSTPAFSVAAIIGIAIGGTVLLALIIGLVVFFLRRRKRKDPTRSVLPPSYEPADSKEGYNKPELDGQALEYRYAEVGTDAPVNAPVVYAELDGGSSASPIRELEGRS